jgi:ribonuclease HI
VSSLVGADSGPEHLHKKVYTKLVLAAEDDVFQYFRGRLDTWRMDCEAMCANLRRCPRSVPQAHRWSVFQILMNAVPTTRRYRFFREHGVASCYFCHSGEDSVQHLSCCSVVESCFDAVVRAAGAMMEWRPPVFFLAVTMNGEELQMTYAFLHAVLRARAALQRGLVFHGRRDLEGYICSLVEHPWLGAAFVSQTKRERRSARASPPAAPDAGTVLYRCDGASRGQGRPDADREASFGAIRMQDGIVQGRYARRIGDESNNVAEYTGALVCLRDARARRWRQVLIQMDSLLVVRQLGFEWRCLSAALRGLYSEAVALLREMQSEGAIVRFAHIYREYNAVADGLANEVLNGGPGMIRENWSN